MKLIPVAQPTITHKELHNVTDCLKSSWISSTGIYIKQFEDQFAQMTNVSYAISCSNGTTALHLALLALGIKTDDEVILPVLTFVAPVNAVRYVGATPIFIDIDPNTWNIDPTQIEAKITPKTKAIIVIHNYGYPCEMKPIIQIAKKYHLKIIEDGAEAHFAQYQNQNVGSFGNIGCFSFYGNKIITTGEGGMIVTHSKTLADRIRLFKNHGMSNQKKYYHPIIGYNYRLTNVQAAIGLAQLQQVDIFLKRRQQIYQRYYQNLSQIPGLVFQPKQTHIKPVCWLFPLLVTKKFGYNRNELMHYLKTKNIDTRPFFYPVTNFPMYKTKTQFPIAQQISQQGLNLPTFVNLTNRHIDFITRNIYKFYSQK